MSNVKTDLFAKSEKTSMRGHPLKLCKGSCSPKGW